jgi:hypothetical protein
MKSLLHTLPAALITTLACLTAPVASADEKVQEANAIYNDIAPESRSDVILLPAIAKIAPPPITASTLEQAVLLPHGSTGWAEAESWAKGETQQKAIAALRDATKPGAASRTPMAFGLRYGYEGVPQEFIRAGMYVELGDPPLLSTAQFRYMPALDRLVLLLNIELTRLMADGKFEESADLCASWFILGRQMADRQFFKEAEWGWRAMAASIERLRDVLYIDFRGKRIVTSAQLKSVIDRLDNVKGNLFLERIRFPKADFLGGQQIVARVFEPKKGPDERTFGPIMARLGSTDRPLRIFSEVAYWKTAGAGHKNWFDTTETLPKIYNDYESRWRLDYLDTRMKQPFEYSQLDKSGFAVIAATTPDYAPIFELRQVVKTEIAGTRLALSVLAMYYDTKNWPTTLSSVRPRYITVLDADPFNTRTDRSKDIIASFQFFVPMRETKARFGPREEVKPHQLNIVTETGANFSVRLRDDQFVLYSVGPDDTAGWAERVQNTAAKAPGADFLIWPCLHSLYRQHLQEVGQLK